MVDHLRVGYGPDDEADINLAGEQFIAPGPGHAVGGGDFGDSAAFDSDGGDDQAGA